MTPERDTYTLGQAGLMRLENIYRSPAGQEQVQQTLAPLPLCPGLTVLDVGCGTGHFTRQIAQRVAPGIVTGIDNDPKVLELAENLAAEEGIANVRFVCAEAPQLPQSDNHSDLVFVRLFLHHLRDPHPALEECLRVLRPGGRLAVNEVDVFMGTFYPPDPVMEQFQAFLDFLRLRVGIDKYLGRKLFSMLREAGLREISVHIIPDVIAGIPDDARLENVRMLLLNWRGLLAEHMGAQQVPRFEQDLLAYLQREDTLTSFTIYLVQGLKP